MVDVRLDSSRPIERAWIIAIGSEMLTPFRNDTNSIYITEKLNNLGIEVRGKTIVGDNHVELGNELRHVLGLVDAVFLTGGLGPTEDDLTREVIARVLETPLVEDVKIVDQIRARFSSRGMRMPEVNRCQALIPKGATLLPNPRGTAAGLWIHWRDKVLVALPGPPRELEPMFDESLQDRLRKLTRDVSLSRRVLRITGLAESQVEELTQPIYSRWQNKKPPIATSILAAFGRIEIHLSVRAATETEGLALLDQAVEDLAQPLGSSLYSSDGRALEQVVGDLLCARKWKIAVAESCTGGLISSRLTDVSGSSAYFEMGVVAYGNDTKIKHLGVPKLVLNEHGAVSESIAAAMASGVRSNAGTELGIGVTGVAGPSGGTQQKPVGTVVFAVETSDRQQIKTMRFYGGRELVNYQASQFALDMVRRILEDRD
jgi:nicotinamide-nucleotide amidase